MTTYGDKQAAGFCRGVVTPGKAPLAWSIIGGESGPGARPCRVEWVRDIVRQCQDASVEAFVKQLGANSDHPGVTGHGGDMDQWPEDLRVREMPETDR